MLWELIQIGFGIFGLIYCGWFLNKHLKQVKFDQLEKEKLCK